MSFLLSGSVVRGGTKEAAAADDSDAHGGRNFVAVERFSRGLIPWWRARARRCLPETDNGGAKRCCTPTTLPPRLPRSVRTLSSEGACWMRKLSPRRRSPRGLSWGFTGRGTNRWARCLSSLDEAVEALLPSVVADSVKGDACARE